MIRYHLDESVRTAIAVGLRSHGVDVTTTVEVGLLGAADEDHIAYALNEALERAKGGDDPKLVKVCAYITSVILLGVSIGGIIAAKQHSDIHRNAT